jgi:hypothetical protein
VPCVQELPLLQALCEGRWEVRSLQVAEAIELRWIPRGRFVFTKPNGKTGPRAQALATAKDNDSQEVFAQVYNDTVGAEKGAARQENLPAAKRVQPQQIG